MLERTQHRSQHRSARLRPGCNVPPPHCCVVAAGQQVQLVPRELNSVCRLFMPLQRAQGEQMRVRDRGSSLKKEVLRQNNPTRYALAAQQWVLHTNV